MSRGRHVARTGQPAKVTWGVIGLLLGLALALAIPAGAASWSEKVTGGGWASAGGTDFSLTMSASDVGGQWEYVRADGSQIAHGTVACVYIHPDLSYAVMSGPVTHVAAGSLFVEGETWTIAVREGGEGSGDQVRIWKGDNCGAYADSYPGTYFDGNVNIRTR